MRFGANSEKITVLREGIIAPDASGNTRSTHVAAWATWANWRLAGSRPVVDGNLAQDASDLVIRVNDSPRNRTLSIADRIRMRSGTYAIVSSSPPDRSGGFVEITIRRQIGG